MFQMLFIQVTASLSLKSSCENPESFENESYDMSIILRYGTMLVRWPPDYYIFSVTTDNK